MKRMIKQEEIKKLAELSRISVPDDELADLTRDIESILEYISQIQDVVSEEVVPAAGEHRNIMREDGEPHRRGVFSEDLLKAAPMRDGSYVKVKKILDQDQ